MTKEKFADEFRVLCEFLNYKANLTEYNVWYNNFKKYSASEFKEAIKLYLENEEERFFPMPARVKQYCVEKGVEY
jgi:hypothetical protein